MVVSTRRKFRQRFLMTSSLCAILVTSIFFIDVASMTASATSRAGGPTPTMYFPDECVSTFVNGFNEGLVVSQRGNRYLPNTACTMYFSVRAASKHIRFTFEHMDLPETSPGDCEDYIQFYVSDNGEGWTAIGQRLCGYAPPDDIVSHDTNVSVVFTSNAFRERSGFRFYFQLEQTTQVCAPGRGCIARSGVAARVPSHNGKNGTSRFPVVLSSTFILGLLFITILVIRRQLTTWRYYVNR